MLTLFCFSCKLNDPCKGLDTSNLQINGPTSVNASDTLILEVPYFPNTNYQWSGPEYFSSNENRISVIVDNENYAGDYSVSFASDDECVSQSETRTVTVNPVSAPCNPTPDWIDYANTHEALGGTYTSSDYQIYCSNFGIDLTITFISTPVTGIYRTIDYSIDDFDMKHNMVRMNLTDFYNYGGEAGNLLYVTVANGKITASFCNITFGSFDATGSVTVDL